MRNSLRIVIQSRDRPEYLKEAIDSVLNQRQENVDIKLLVSDNSIGDEVGSMVNAFYSDEDFDYVRRDPPLNSAVNHTKLIISECEEDYVVLFHDDDVLRPNYVEIMFPFIQNQGVAAVGCNTYIFKNDLAKHLKAKPHKFNKPKQFISEKEFLMQYIPNSYGVAVYPGYMYKLKCLKKINQVNNYRKNGGNDILILNSLLTYGSIVWIPDYLVYYRLHDSNDGNNLYTVDHILILNSMARNGIDKHTTAASMRFNYMLQWFIAQDIKNIFSWRNRTVLKYLFFKSFYLMSRIDLWKSLVNNRYVKNKILQRR